MSNENRQPDPFAALVAVSAALELPRSFVTDLRVHDRFALASRDPALPFLWCLYDCGTHLVLPHEGDPNNRVTRAPIRAARLVKAIEDAFGRERCHWFWWDGHELRAVSGAEGRELVHEAEASC